MVDLVALDFSSVAKFYYFGNFEFRNFSEIFFYTFSKNNLIEFHLFLVILQTLRNRKFLHLFSLAMN